jgi:hypothetical protein
MRVPQWLTLLVAAWVIVFGLYRLWLAKDPKQDLKKAEGKKGIFALKRTTQALFGVVYLLLGVALIATSFGWNPLGDMFSPSKGGAATSGSGAGTGTGAGSGSGSGSAKPTPHTIEVH